MEVVYSWQKPVLFRGHLDLPCPWESSDEISVTVQKQMSSGNDEDGNAISRILGNRRQETGHLTHHFSFPFSIFGNRVNNTNTGSKNGIKASQTRELDRTGEWEPPHHSTEAPAHSSSLEATNSPESWASYHPHTATPAHRAHSKTLKLGLIFFYLCIYIIIISPTDLDIWIVHRQSFTVSGPRADLGGTYCNLSTEAMKKRTKERMLVERINGWWCLLCSAEGFQLTPSSHN